MPRLKYSQSSLRNAGEHSLVSIENTTTPEIPLPITTLSPRGICLPFLSCMAEPCAFAHRSELSKYAAVHGQCKIDTGRAPRLARPKPPARLKGRPFFLIDPPPRLARTRRRGRTTSMSALGTTVEWCRYSAAYLTAVCRSMPSVLAIEYGVSPLAAR